MVINIDDTCEAEKEEVETEGGGGEYNYQDNKRVMNS